MNSDEIWVVDDDPALRWVMDKALTDAGYEVRLFASAEEAQQALTSGAPAVLVSDVRLPGASGFDLLKSLHREHPKLPVIVVTAHADLESAVTAYQGGAFEYLPKPFDVDELAALVQRALQTQPGTQPSAAAVDEDVLVGEAPAMQQVFRAIGRLTRSHMTALVTGESGTGKELVARGLHRHSPRARQPFIALNTAAIPAELLESELFGHERGSFTGAAARRIGRFEQAHTGTLFLDEIGDMSPALQTRLLRVLAEGEFYRVGGHEAVKVDVRIIAATHQDLQARVEEGTFREDLFHRLNVVHVHMPALRERREDIPLLLEHFMDAAARELNVAAKRLTADALQALSERPWPGNVRELKNFCRRLMLMAPGRIVHKSDLGEVETSRSPREESGDWRRQLRAWADAELAAGNPAALARAEAQFERILMDAALAKTAGRKQEAAGLLGWGRNTLTRKLKDSDRT
ncbi:MAG TPA: nitrogen regulation protein NR(I) [Gammaproteobacteria bacterium]|jgi:two-component system nitrogen regulation response regulator GlnG|nr:nitrogen regulation protein NR(I) [Gammaproteobacteria bacterium]